MGNEYRAKVFKSGNSVAVRLPKALGIAEGTELVLREDGDDLRLVRAQERPRKIDLTGIYGSIARVERLPFDEVERDWGRGMDHV